MTARQGTAPASRRSRIVSALALLAILCTALVGLAVRSGSAEAPLVGRPAPALAGETLDGGPLDLQELRGSVVLVNVWASWCAPCRDELPLLAGLHERFGGAGLHVVGIDFRDRDGPARDLLTRSGADAFPSVRDPDGRLSIAWGVFGIPETILVDRDGVVRDRLIGPVSAEWLRTRVVPLVAAPA